MSSKKSLSPTFQYPMSYPLNRANAKKFIAASAPDARDAVRKFIKATTHISFETFISYVNKNLGEVVKLVPDGRPIFLNVGWYFKSNYWLSLYMRDLTHRKYNIQVHFIDGIDDPELQDNDVILLVDDCIYSGNQMADTIHSFGKTSYKLNIILFVPFISDTGANQVIQAKKTNKNMQYCTFTIAKYVYKIQPLSTYMSINEMMKILKYYKYNIYYDMKSDADLRNKAEYELSKYPIYFDHKLADFQSSFPFIYSGVVPNEFNSNIFEQILDLTYKTRTHSTNEKLSQLHKQYLLYPLISNCDYINKGEYTQSSCPPAPYKEKYNEFISIIKMLRRRRSSIRQLSSHRPRKSRTVSRSTSSLLKSSISQNQRSI